MSISGDQLALLGDKELKQVAQTHTIFCKLTPLQNQPGQDFAIRRTYRWFSRGRH